MRCLQTWLCSVSFTDNLCSKEVAKGAQITKLIRTHFPPWLLHDRYKDWFLPKRAGKLCVTSSGLDQVETAFVEAINCVLRVVFQPSVLSDPEMKKKARAALLVKMHDARRHWPLQAVVGDSSDSSTDATPMAATVGVEASSAELPVNASSAADGSLLVLAEEASLLVSAADDVSLPSVAFALACQRRIKDEVIDMEN
ncbi:hypothetical protein CAOG_009936 [Capsaspora owczarzaki ATCC 30864]|uniref:Uncharacterized protein n=1 Tax=Capsaspora owczarzaki (strain ATCC 30864) TaxID=595528 RepID=A0A0D2UKC6_CAPO3|nr:hypothetical protein CAOG_009936 [Capsaspora owczarzaki ATCC 30864]